MRISGVFLVSIAVACGPTPPVAKPPKSDVPAPSPLPSRSEPLPEIDRPTSAPYAGDPSIYEHPKRGERLQIENVMDVLGISTGTTVADVGAGGGWFTVRAARRVGPSGLVYAVEINAAYVELIRERAEKDGLPNVRALLASESEPGLGRDSIDVVLLLKTYHELSKPLAVMQSLHRSLKTSGRLGVIDRNGRGDDHGIDEAVMRREIESVGFSFRERHDLKSEQERVDYFLVFTR